VKRYGWKDDRGTRQERGYDEPWRKARAECIRRKTFEAATSGESAYPICELCGKPVVDRREIHVDHITPFKGKDDPLRLDHENMRITHMRCHMRRTARQSHEGPG
jgi:5-methylcytosine-specific restriction endonuclease McrA